MKIVIAVTEGMPEAVSTVLGSSEFAKHSLKIIGNVLSVKDVLHRPAEYCVQAPISTVSLGSLGVNLTLTGVSRGARESEQFHRVLQGLHDLAETSIIDALSKVDPSRIQLFCALELDGEVRVPHEWGGGYSRLLEFPPVWLSASGVEKKPD